MLNLLVTAYRQLELIMLFQLRQVIDSFKDFIKYPKCLLLNHQLLLFILGDIIVCLLYIKTTFHLPKVHSH